MARSPVTGRRSRAFLPRRAYFRNSENLYEASEGWFVKHRFAFGLEETDPLYRFGTPENLEISKWLSGQQIPVGGPPAPWQAIQPEFEFFGVPTIDPIPYYGRVKITF